MKDRNKTKKQLISELTELRQRIAELEAAETERKQIEGALRKAERQFRDLYENAPNAYFSVGVDGIIRRCNRRAAELLGWAIEDLVGRSVFELYADTPQGKEKASHLFERFRAGRAIVGEELQMQKADGTLMWIGLTVNAVHDARGQVVESRSMVVDTTERKQAEEALQESEEKFRNLAEHSPNMVFINDGGRVVYANRRCEEMMGYTRDQFYSAGFDFLTLIAPDHRESVKTNFGKHIQGEDIEPYEYALITRDGRRIEAILTTRLIDYEGEKAILGTVTDITERRQAEEALRESEGKYRTLFETMAQGVVYQSADGHITSANPAAERILGLTLDQMQGRTSTDPRWKAIREDGLDFPGDTHPAMEALKTGKEVRNFVMGVFNPRKEDYTWININAVPQFRSGEGKPYQVYTTFEDITQRKRAEEQIKASLREKEAMLVEIHHRVKNNLQIITSLLDFQAAFAQNEQAGELLRESIDRVRSMVLIHDQLYQAPDLAQIDFADYVQTLTANLFAAYRVDPIPVITLQLDVQDVFLEIKEAIPCGLLINELVSNALKYAFPTTRDWPRSFTGEIGVSFRATGEGEYTLVVSDNGVGLPPDFEFPNENTLGLLLTNALVRQLGGSVEWDGDGGTTCRIVFGA